MLLLSRRAISGCNDYESGGSFDSAFSKSINYDSH